jgi:hypothetical protein
MKIKKKKQRILRRTILMIDDDDEGEKYVKTENTFKIRP